MPFDNHEFPQVIPTPAHVSPGAEPPWAELSAQRRSGLSLDRVAQALRAAGRHFDVAQPPAEPAELRALVGGGVDVPITRRSSVLVALFEEDGEARVILTRRSIELKNHRGEVALPGGRNDPGEDSVTTALREAHEEVGLDPGDVTVVGWLSPIVTFASGSAIQPIVGLLSGRPNLVANPVEVERVFDVSLTDLLQADNFREQRWRRDVPRPGADPDASVAIYFFRVPGEVVWGATGRVLAELLAVATGTHTSLPRWSLG